MIDLLDGVPAINGPKPVDFEEFWPFFLSQHLNAKTRMVHQWGTVVYTLGTLAVLFGFKRRTAALIAMAAGAAQVASHRIFEGNKARDTDRVAQPRLDWPLRADYLMVCKIFNGTIEDDIELVREAVGLKPDQITLADAGMHASHLD